MKRFILFVSVAFCFHMLLVSCTDSSAKPTATLDDTVNSDTVNSDADVLDLSDGTDSLIKVTSVLVSKDKLMPGQTVRVKATVVVDNGMVVGSVLALRDGLLLGDCQKAADGSWEIELTWDQLVAYSMHSVPGGFAEVLVVVQARAVSGEVAEKAAMIGLGCQDSSLGLCKGSCVDMFDDFQNCGSCGLTCSAELCFPDGTCGPIYGTTPYCASGHCGNVGGLFFQSEEPPEPTFLNLSCADVCAMHTLGGLALKCYPSCGVTYQGFLEDFGYGLDAGMLSEGIQGGGRVYMGCNDTFADVIDWTLYYGISAQCCCST